MPRVSAVKMTDNEALQILDDIWFFDKKIKKKVGSRFKSVDIKT